MVLYETTEEGRHFHFVWNRAGEERIFQGITISKVFSVLCTMGYPCSSPVRCWGQVLIFLKKHFTVNLLTEEGPLPAGLEGWRLKFVQHIADTSCLSPSPAGPPGNCPSHFLHRLNLSFVMGMHARSEGEPMFCMQLGAKAKLHRKPST